MSSLSLVASERGLRPPTHIVGAANIAGTLRTWLLRRSVSWVIPKLGKLVFWQKKDLRYQIQD
ncbi:hypothetical protein CsSME_00019356 [Camellia sinensis var. sinensis]